MDRKAVCKPNPSPSGTQVMSTLTLPTLGTPDPKVQPCSCLEAKLRACPAPPQAPCLRDAYSGTVVGWDLVRA